MAKVMLAMADKATGIPASRMVAAPVLYFLLGSIATLPLSQIVFQPSKDNGAAASTDKVVTDRKCICPQATASSGSPSSRISKTNGDKTLGTENAAWQSIDVFVGKRSYFYNLVDVNRPLSSWAKNKAAAAVATRGAWYSQVRQDSIVAALLRYPSHGGYYLDLAANDAVKWSNTFALDRFFHWNGLCMEANPQYWFDLARLRTCHVVGAAVGGDTSDTSRKSNGDPVFFSFNNEYGGIVNEQFDNKLDTAKGKYFFPTPLLQLLQRYEVPNVIDYMSLDVEGAESFIMKDFPFDQYDIKILTGERLKRDLRDLLQAKGYVFKVFLSEWGEGLWINSKYEAQLDLSAIPVSKSHSNQGY